MQSKSNKKVFTSRSSLPSVVLIRLYPSSLPRLHLALDPRHPKGRFRENERNFHEIFLTVSWKIFEKFPFRVN